MIDKLLSTLLSFTVHGSGWLVDEMKTVELKMAGFAPMKGSSYLDSPSELHGVRRLLNIRNHLENNCFLYCFQRLTIFSTVHRYKLIIGEQLQIRHSSAVTTLQLIKQ